MEDLKNLPIFKKKTNFTGKYSRIPSINNEKF